MVERFFRDGVALRRLRANPLGCHLDSFSTLVAQCGYARSTIRSQLWLLADLGRWLKRKGLRVGDLDLRITDAFLHPTTRHAQRAAWQRR